MPTSRRGFLRGRFRSHANELRPPWALPAEAFEDQCDGCRACVPACPNGIVVAGGGGLPKVDFTHGECSFCGECVRVCASGALVRDEDRAPWALKAVIAEGCLATHGVECRVCGEACGVGAIRFMPQRGGVAKPLLEIERCTGCGACYAPCPIGAIEVTNTVENTQ